jgi:hypothetical protein
MPDTRYPDIAPDTSDNGLHKAMKKCDKKWSLLSHGRMPQKFVAIQNALV